MFVFIDNQVQPFKDSEQLHQMMRDMQVQYNQQRYEHPSVDKIKEGRLYAVLHHDGHWYRYVATLPSLLHCTGMLLLQPSLSHWYQYVATPA
jgi:hypothetical protein